MIHFELQEFKFKCVRARLRQVLDTSAFTKEGWLASGGMGVPSTTRASAIEITSMSLSFSSADPKRPVSVSWSPFSPPASPTTCKTIIPKAPLGRDGATGTTTFTHLIDATGRMSTGYSSGIRNGQTAHDRIAGQAEISQSLLDVTAPLVDLIVLEHALHVEHKPTSAASTPPPTRIRLNNRDRSACKVAETRMVLNKINARRVIHAEYHDARNNFESEPI
ncbi:hypothetical protein C8F04DRAFT_1252799 [Mycena alexandri]|uniref:Uncharacterized protein n=1 Tax=Mycena alexandri TaxID=1745969 RepID=A0AAD6XB18_9AGAR|nr:hypothetical protein C8F04DRAFT_1256751 [Mycena alexandri]KAJ7041466.1 hypothetical protein C8F04DRAFT_1252799 [Mycena alexandri]